MLASTKNKTEKGNQFSSKLGHCTSKSDIESILYYLKKDTKKSINIQGRGVGASYLELCHQSVEHPVRSQSSHCGPLHYWRKQKLYALVQMQLTFTKPHLTQNARLMALHLQYTGCMLQAGEFKNVKFEITISSEFRNSTRWGRLWFSLWERSHCHHTDPWPSITPLFPGISG